MAQADGKLIFDTKIDTSGFTSGLSKLGSAAKTGLKAITTAIAAVGAALGGMAVYAIKTGIEFESAFAGIRKTVDATEEQFARLEKSILEMTKRIPVSAAELASIGEAAGQLGIKTENIEGFIGVMADLSVATNMTSDEAATALARLANITQMPQTEFDRLGSTVVALGNNFATTESEIVDMALRLAGSGKQVGMTEANIMSFSAALSSVGVNAEAGGTAFSKLMANMQLATVGGGSDLQDFAKVAGMSSEQFKKAFQENAAGAINSFIVGLSKSQEKGKTAIEVLDEMGVSEIRLRDSLLRAAGASNVFSEALAIGNMAWKDNTALTKEAEQRYATMESRIQLLKNGVQRLGITFYQSTNKEIGDAVVILTGYVSELETAFSSGGLTELVKKLGDIFGDLSVKVADAAPGMIDVAVAFIESFVEGISKNTKQIAESSKKIVEALVKGIVGLAPKIYDAAMMLMKEIVRAFMGNGVANAVQKLGDTIKNTLALAIRIITPIVQGFASVMGGLLQVVAPLTPVIIGVVAAMKTMAVINTVNSMIKGLIKVYESATFAVGWYTAAVAGQTTTEAAASLATAIATGKLTLKQIAVGVLTGQITLATAAQGLWNAVMAANPIGLVAVAVAALAVGIVALTMAMGSQKTESNLLTESVREQKQAYDDLKISQEQNIAASLSEIAYVEKLKNELLSLMDANGYVEAANRSRVAFILGELNNALGTEYKMINGIVQGNEEIVGSIDKIIEKKKAEIFLRAYEDQYAEAIKNVTKAQQAQTKTYDAIIAKQEELSKLEGNTTIEGSRRIAAIESSLRGLYKQYEENAEVVQTYSNDISKYESAAADAINGEHGKVIKALDSTGKAYKTAADVAGESAEQQKRIVGQSFADAVTELEVAQRNYDANKNEFNRKQLVQAKTNAENMKTEYEKVGGNVVDGMVVGIGGKEINLKTKISNLMAAVPGWAKNLLGIRSPSTVFEKEIGAMIVAGLVKGIDKNSHLVKEAIERMNDGIMDSERIYLSEKKRIEDEQSAEEERRYQKEYEERLKKAKNDVEREKIKEEEILRNKKIADQKYLDLLQETADKQREEMEQLKKDIRDIYAEIAEYAEKEIGSVIKSQEKLEAKLKGFGRIVDEISFLGMGENGEDLTFRVLHDQQQDIDVLKDYKNTLLAAKNRMKAAGFDEDTIKGFFADMADLSVEDGIEYAKLLVRATEDEFAKHVGGWADKQSISKSISEELYSDEMQTAIDKSAKNMKDKLTEVGLEVPEGFFVSGTLSAEKFGTAFVEELDKQMKKIRTYIEQFDLTLTPQVALAGAGGGVVTTNNFSSTYVVNNPGETTSSALRAADNHAALEKQRRG